MGGGDGWGREGYSAVVTTRRPAPSKTTVLPSFDHFGFARSNGVRKYVSGCWFDGQPAVVAVIGPTSIVLARMTTGADAELHPSSQ